jgi:hypothetical protein
MLQYLISRIFYMAIMHNHIFGQAHNIDLLKGISKKSILHFYDFYTIYYEFSKLKRISRI